MFSVVVGCRRLSSVVVGCCRLLSLLSVVVGCLCLLVSRRSRPSRWLMATSLPSWGQMEDGESSEQASTRGRNCAGHRKRRRTSAPGAWSSGSPRLGGAAVLFQCVCVCGTFLGGAFGNALRSCGCWVSRGSPNVALQVLLRGSLSPPCARVCDVFRLALLGLQGASWQKQCAELGVACLYQVRGRCALCPLVWRGGARVCTLALCRR